MNETLDLVYTYLHYICFHIFVSNAAQSEAEQFGEIQSTFIYIQEITEASPPRLQ